MMSSPMLVLNLIILLFDILNTKPRWIVTRRCHLIIETRREKLWEYLCQDHDAVCDDDCDDDEDDNDIMEFQGVGNYGDVDVTLVREDVLAFYTLRTFNIQVI